MADPVSAASPKTPTLGGFPIPHRAIVAMCALAIGDMVALAMLSLSENAHPAPPLIAAAIFIVVGALLASSRAARMPPGLSAVAVVLPTALALIAGSTALGDGFSRWYLGAGALTLLLLALRNRILLAWIGAAAQLIVGAAVGVATGLDLTTSIELVLRQTALLAVGTIFAVGIRGSQRRLVELERSAVHDAVRIAAEQAAASARTERLEWAHLLSTRLLRQVADGEELTPAMRLDARLTEAELRDGLRGAGLAQPPVPAAARAARARGVEVVLLDDHGGAEIPLELHERALRLVADTLDETPDGRLVARLLPAGRDDVLTIVAEGATERWIALPGDAGDGTPGA